jgi:hypothetical protein
MDTDGFRVQVAGNVLFRDVGNEAVLLNLATSSYFGLNEIGARVWRLLASGASLAGVLEALQSEYDVPEEQLRRDLRALVDELVAEKLLVVETI